MSILTGIVESECTSGKLASSRVLLHQSNTSTQLSPVTSFPHLSVFRQCSIGPWIFLNMPLPKRRCTWPQLHIRHCSLRLCRSLYHGAIFLVWECSWIGYKIRFFGSSCSQSSLVLRPRTFIARNVKSTPEIKWRRGSCRCKVYFQGDFRSQRNVRFAWKWPCNTHYYTPNLHGHTFQASQAQACGSRCYSYRSMSFVIHNLSLIDILFSIDSFQSTTILTLPLIIIQQKATRIYTDSTLPLDGHTGKRRYIDGTQSTCPSHYWRSRMVYRLSFAG